MISRFLRPIIYLSLVGGLIFAAEIQKDRLREQNLREAPTILGEYLRLGIPVDVQKLELETWQASLLVTLRSCGSGVADSCFSISGDQRRSLRRGQVLLNLKGERLGEIVSVSNTMDLSSAMYPVRVRLDKSKAEGFVSSRVLIGSPQARIVVPTDAVIETAAGAHVWLKGPTGEAQRRVVEIESRGARQTVIRSGLKADEVLIVNGARGLQEGARLRVRKIADKNENPVMGGRL